MKNLFRCTAILQLNQQWITMILCTFALQSCFAVAHAQAIRKISVNTTSAQPIASNLKTGDVVHVKGNFDSTDPGDPAEGEFLYFTSDHGFKKAITTYGDIDFVFSPSSNGETLSAYIQNFDADEECNLTVTVCPQAISQVALPAEQDTIAPEASYTSLSLSLNFTMVTNENDGVVCEYRSNLGTLLLYLKFFGFLPVPSTSSTVATVTIFEPGVTGPLAPCNFVGFPFPNGCLINGTYNSSHYYAKWTSPGFFVAPPFILTPPLEYWVDLNELGISPESVNMDPLLRTVEKFLHVELTKLVVIPTMIGVSPATEQTSTQLALKNNSAHITITNSSEMTIKAPIRIVLGKLPLFVSAKGYNGTFFTAPYFTVNSDLAPGQSKSIDVQFNNPLNRSISFETQVYSGTFYGLFSSP